jgi:hypothetical protein
VMTGTALVGAHQHFKQKLRVLQQEGDTQQHSVKSEADEPAVVDQLLQLVLLQRPRTLHSNFKGLTPPTCLINNGLHPFPHCLPVLVCGLRTRVHERNRCASSPTTAYLCPEVVLSHQPLPAHQLPQLLPPTPAAAAAQLERHTPLAQVPSHAPPQVST